MRKRYVYLLERIHDSKDWPKGCRIWTHQKCAGWRVVDQKPVS